MKMIEKIDSEGSNNNNNLSALGIQDIANIFDESKTRKQYMQKRIDKIKSFKFQFNQDEREQWNEKKSFDNAVDEVIEKVPMLTENNNHYYIFGDLAVYVDDMMGITLGDIKNALFYSKQKLKNLPIYQNYQTKVNGTVIDDKDLFVILNEISKLIDGREFHMSPNLFINNDNYPDQQADRKNLLQILRWLYIITGYTGRIPFNFDHKGMDHIDTLSVKPSFVGYTKLDEDQSELRFIMKKNV